MNEIITVDPKQFGLEESKAADIAAQFKPMLDKMVELEQEYNEVISMPIETAASAAKLAAELKAKQDAEKAEAARLAKIEADRIAAEKKAAKAPVKEKLNVAVSALNLELPESEITPDIMAKFNGFKQWALSKINNL
jgi:hypothetical protein